MRPGITAAPGRYCGPVGGLAAHGCRQALEHPWFASRRADGGDPISTGAPRCAEARSSPRLYARPAGIHILQITHFAASVTYVVAEVDGRAAAHVGLRCRGDNRGGPSFRERADTGPCFPSLGDVRKGRHTIRRRTHGTEQVVSLDSLQEIAARPSRACGIQIGIGPERCHEDHGHRWVAGGQQARRGEPIQARQFAIEEGPRRADDARSPRSPPSRRPPWRRPGNQVPDRAAGASPGRSPRSHRPAQCESRALVPRFHLARHPRAPASRVEGPAAARIVRITQSPTVLTGNAGRRAPLRRSRARSRAWWRRCARRPRACCRPSGDADRPCGRSRRDGRRSGRRSTHR